MPSAGSCLAGGNPSGGSGFPAVSGGQGPAGRPEPGPGRKIPAKEIQRPGREAAGSPGRRIFRAAKAVLPGGPAVQAPFREQSPAGAHGQIRSEHHAGGNFGLRQPVSHPVQPGPLYPVAQPGAGRPQCLRRAGFGGAGRHDRPRAVCGHPLRRGAVPGLPLPGVGPFGDGAEPVRLRGAGGPVYRRGLRFPGSRNIGHRHEGPGHAPSGWAHHRHYLPRQ